jgi:hypothetical protein
MAVARLALFSFVLWVGGAGVVTGELDKELVSLEDYGCCWESSDGGVVKESAVDEGGSTMGLEDHGSCCGRSGRGSCKSRCRRVAEVRRDLPRIRSNFSFV